ncbi:MAG: class I tRNA ligase family protein [Comamonadaceae bacterium]|nr:class I tRNA ligase family protein [Comamonadaceae bacterium]
MPAHDARDFEFARTYRIPIRTVIVPPEKAGGRFDAEPAEVSEESGVLVNSGPFDGLTSEKAMEEMGKYAEDKGFGRRSTIFRLRDWGISRQRYWGTPIPVIYCDACGIVGVPDADLPVELPFDVKLTGEEGSPLERHETFVRTTCPKCHGPARRETDTMDTFVDSSWYFFRYCSPRETTLPFRPEAAKAWLPVDLYIGGVEHAILHLIYSRFFTKVLRDFGMTEISEPFPHYLAQGMVTKDGSAMSKSKGNIVDPDEILARYGADALRLFILFASPPDKEFAWSEDGLEGCSRFLFRVWTLVHENLDLFASAPAGAPAAPGAGDAAAQLVKQDPPDHPQGDRGHRRPLPPQHGHQLDHGALQPDPQGARCAEGVAGRPGRPPPGPGIHRPHALALRAPHGRGALGEDRPPRPPHALGLARLRSGPGPRGDGHGGRPGQRQGQGPVRGRPRPPRGRARGGRARAAEGAGGPGRKGAPQGRRPSATSSSAS